MSIGKIVERGYTFRYFISPFGDDYIGAYTTNHFMPYYNDISKFIPLTLETEGVLKMIYPSLTDYDLISSIDKLAAVMLKYELRDPSYIINLNSLTVC